MKKLIKVMIVMSCVFLTFGCTNSKEESQPNNTNTNQGGSEESQVTPANSKYIEGWGDEKRKLDGCSYTFLTPNDISGYQYFRGCNKFTFTLKNSTEEVKVLFNSLTNFDGKDVALTDINERLQGFRTSNLHSIFDSDGNVQYNEKFENVTVAGYEALLDKGAAQDSTGFLFNYAIYQLYLGEEKDGVVELLVGSETLDSNSLAEIGEELIATIQPLE
ncbi:MAG TPA: hypothetical protein IAB58_02565 [Candidatus Pelethosoma merdigallinarum]|nr:hypothetical protein [Candidatus Pelethosoma merdigallinarum]